MSSSKNRREFLQKLGALSLTAGLGSSLSFALPGCGPAGNKTGENGSSAASDTSAAGNAAAAGELFFKISLAEWSFNKDLFSGKLDNLDFPAKAKNGFGIEAVEYVNQFFKDKAGDKAYLAELKERADDLGVVNLRIMIDGEGFLGDTDEAARLKAVESHYKWVEAAKALGCTDIRVNAYGEGTAEEVAAAAVDGLGRLTGFAQDFDISVIVENHGSYSSNGEWLAGVMKQVNNPNCGTLPDFGNFCIKREPVKGDTPEDYLAAKCLEEYDRYKGVAEMMPFARGVSAKSHDFDEQGNETHTDYTRMMKIVKDAGFTGYVGIEYEGLKTPPDEGVRKTLELLKRVGSELS